MMTQEERLSWLIKELQKENPDWMHHLVPKARLNGRDMLRSLLNIRRPLPVSQEFMEIQDAFLQGETAAKGIVQADDLPTIAGHPQIALWRGDITTLAADAIVNAANSMLLGCFVPCHGCIDNAIHSAAGVQLRLECHDIMQRRQYEEPTGSAKITRAYNLPGRFVLHTVGPIIHGAVNECDRALLASCYQSCLELAEEHDIRTLAFCCISTGEFSFPREPAAKIAISTAMAYLERGTRIEKIIFNVFSQEDYEIYRNEFRLLR